MCAEIDFFVEGDNSSMHLCSSGNVCIIVSMYGRIYRKLLKCTMCDIHACMLPIKSYLQNIPDDMILDVGKGKTLKYASKFDIYVHRETTLGEDGELVYSDGAEQLLKETGQRKRAGSSTPSGPPPKKKAHKTAPSTSRRKSCSISQSPCKATKKASPTKKCTPGPVKKHAKSSAKSHNKKGQASSTSVSPLKNASSSLPNNERPSRSPSKESTSHSHVQIRHKA